MDAVLQEYEARRDEITTESFATIYAGGGTPSMLPPELFSPLISLADTGAEITIEANPEDVTEEWTDRILSAGFNRVSMGVQSLINEELTAVGRRHTAAQALRAISVLRSHGISNISCDLIYGLPEQTLESWDYSLQTMLELDLPHLSAYLLSYEPGTRLTARLNTGKISETPEDVIERMYSSLCSLTRQAGMNHYEISNFCKDGMHSRHNSSYWDFTPYLGLGPGAHSFDGRSRRFNPSRLKEYMISPDKFTIQEDLSPHDEHNDRVITSLRTSRGISPSFLNENEQREAIRLLEQTADGYFRIPESAWLMSNALMEPFIRI